MEIEIMCIKLGNKETESAYQLTNVYSEKTKMLCVAYPYLTNWM